MAKSFNLMYYINDFITEKPNKDFFLSANPDPVLVESSKLDQDESKSTKTLIDYVKSNSSAVWDPEDIKVLLVGYYGTHTFAGTMIYAGRNNKSDIIIPDSQTSKIHARFMKHDNNWTIIDESTNGTFIDDKRIKKGAEYKLRSGCKISFGGSTDYEFYTPDKFWDFLEFRTAILKRSME